MAVRGIERRLAKKKERRAAAKLERQVCAVMCD